MRQGSTKEFASQLGSFGVWTGYFEFHPLSAATAAARAIEEMGYGSVWFSHTQQREPLLLASLLLGATRGLVVGNGIVRMAGRDPELMSAAGRTLAEAFPGRHVLGLGVGGDGRSGERPMDFLRRYLEAMNTAGAAPARDSVGANPRTVLAAYGPAMVRAAGTLSSGAHTYLVPVRHTAHARELLGPEPLLIVEQAVVLEEDPGKARELARTLHLRGYVESFYNRKKFHRLGYSDNELVGGGNDRFVDDMVAWGAIPQIRQRLQEHLDAGADHVVVQVLTEGERLPLGEWEALAGALR